MLYNLAFHPQNKDRIVQNKGLEYILGAMLSHPSVPGQSQGRTSCQYTCNMVHAPLQLAGLSCDLRSGPFPPKSNEAANPAVLIDMCPATG